MVGDPGDDEGGRLEDLLGEADEVEEKEDELEPRDGGEAGGVGDGFEVGGERYSRALRNRIYDMMLRPEMFTRLGVGGSMLS